MSSVEQRASEIRRTDLQRHDLSVPGRKVVQNRVDIGPEAPAIKHKHPGEEIIYVLEGLLEYQVEGEPPTTVNADQVFFVPAETIHAVKNVGSGNAAELVTYVVEKGKSLSCRSSERRVNTNEDHHDPYSSQPLPHRRFGRGFPRPPPTHRGDTVAGQEVGAAFRALR